MPGHVHESRVAILETLAALAGFDLDVTYLGDGTRPDVLRARTDEPGWLFLGDAKDTETSGCTDTMLRLSNYLRWGRAAIAGKRGLVFALCVGRPSTVIGWVHLIEVLATDLGVPLERQPVSSLGAGTSVVWWLPTPILARDAG